MSCPSVCGGDLNSKSIVRFSKRNVMLVADFFSKVSRTTTWKTYLNAEMTLKIYKSTNRLMGKNQDAVLLTNDSDTELSNRFSDFFLGKIKIIRKNLQKANGTNDNVVNVLGMDVKLTGKHLVTRLGNFSQNRHVSLTQCLHIYLNSVLTTFYQLLQL